MPFKTLVIIDVKGGSGSGNWGHAGIPGKVGGSAPKGGTFDVVAIADSAHSLLQGKGARALTVASKKIGIQYFGEGLIYSKPNAIVSESADYTQGDLVDPDWAYVFEYNTADSSASRPEGYDPNVKSSAAVLERDYIDEYYANNQSGDKLLVTYDAGTSELVVWKPSGSPSAPLPKGALHSIPKKGSEIDDMVRKVIPNVTDRQFRNGYLLKDRWGNVNYHVGGEVFTAVNDWAGDSFPEL